MSTINRQHPNIWPPFSNLKTTPPPIKVKSGSGIYLELEDGRTIIDAISSWWVNVLGHSRPEIADAIYEQAQKLEHVIFAGFTHDPAEQIAEKVTQLLPGNLNKAFFSDNGSTAVEVAQKMAYQYWINRDEKRTSFICFEGAYHGDTIGAMSAGERSVFTNVFKDLMFDVTFVPYPATFEGDPEQADKEDKVIAKIEQLLEENPNKYAGILLEPLIQGAGGMRMCRPEFLQKLHWVNRQYGTLLMFDEVMTGFGRTGDWFASLKAQVEPDIICMAKGLTGGFLPLSLTVCSDEIYDAFYDEDPYKALYHGHSYTANPLGCAAAVAAVDLLEKHQDGFKEMDQWHHELAEPLRQHPKIEKVRITGTIAAMDIVTEGKKGYLNKVAPLIKKRSVDKGVLLRPLGDVLYIMPPYCIEKNELAEIYRVIQELLEEL